MEVAVTGADVSNRKCANVFTVTVSFPNAEEAILVMAGASGEFHTCDVCMSLSFLFLYCLTARVKSFRFSRVVAWPHLLARRLSGEKPTVTKLCSFPFLFLPVDITAHAAASPVPIGYYVG